MSRTTDKIMFLIRDRDKNDAYLINDITKHGSNTLKISYEHPNGRSYTHTVSKQDIHGRVVDIKGRFLTMADDPATIKKETKQVHRLSRGTAVAMMSANLPKKRPLSATQGSPNTRKKTQRPTRMNQVTYPSPKNGGHKSTRKSTRKTTWRKSD